MHDCVILGGGVIGLAIAYELAEQGLTVQVWDAQQAGQATSWAAAGALPPPVRGAKQDWGEQLRAVSHDLYPDWCARLQDASGIDPQFSRCGGIYLARRAGETAALRAAVAQWQSEGVQLASLSGDQLAELEPELARGESTPAIRAAYLLPDEAQVRPPRLLRALLAAVQARGVPVRTGMRLHAWHQGSDGTLRLETADGVLQSRYLCIAAGAWTGQVLESFGHFLPVEPRRGQMVLWNTPRPLFRHVLNEGPRYLVPRRDGRVLAGSTVEDVGFDQNTTPEAIEELVQFAHSLLPALRDHPLEQAWAGLRPGSRDGLPYLGPLPDQPQIIIASGHFRSGIHFAPATALLVRQILLDQQPVLPLAPFAPLRH